jgi:hypothetical protein
MMGSLRKRMHHPMRSSSIYHPWSGLELELALVVVLGWASAWALVLVLALALALALVLVPGVEELALACLGSRRFGCKFLCNRCYTILQLLPTDIHHKC